MRDERTHPHRPRLVVYHSTCRPLSSSPPREQLCNRSCSNKHTLFLSFFPPLSPSCTTQEGGAGGEDEPALLRLPLVSLQRLCVALALSEEGSDEDLHGLGLRTRDRLKENLVFVPEYDRRTLREKMLGDVSLPIMEALLAKMPEETAAWLGAQQLMVAADRCLL